jgi:NADH-quinone oxidoreductase subunit C
MFEDIFNDLKKQFTLQEITRNEERLNFITVPKEQTVSLITYLKYLAGYRHLVLLTAVDYIERGKFQLTYILNHPEKRIDIGVRTLIEREPAVMDSAHHLWPTIATYQRELKEMFGIDFPGSPRLDEPFILEGWEGTPPYRRDFDTKAFAEDFYHQRDGRTTQDPAKYMKEKLYPNE